MRLKLLLPLFLLLLQSAFGSSPSVGLQRLIDGNLRYVEDHPTHADHSADRRIDLVQSQTPFAVIVSCSDSRVTPEVIFDQSAGDLFVVRVAGNVVGPIELDSIDYAATVLGSSLILVLGHESCGAVKAVIEKKAEGIEHVAELIEPAVKKITNLEKAVKANAKYVASQLKKKPLLKKLECKAAYYSIATGKVEILP